MVGTPDTVGDGEVIGVLGVVTGVDGGAELGSPPEDFDVQAPAHRATAINAPTTGPALMAPIIANTARNGHRTARICG